MILMKGPFGFGQGVGRISRHKEFAIMPREDLAMKRHILIHGLTGLR